MATTKRVRKRYLVDVAKIKRLQKAMGTATEREAIERALDFAISKHERNRRALAAHQRFFSSGIQIDDVFGNLDSK